MLEIKNFLRNNSIKPVRYKKNGKVTFIETDNERLVLKESNPPKDIFKLLEVRNFNYYPKVIARDNNYEITEYIEEIELPDEQKLNDLIDLVSLLHNKTTYYKDINSSDNKKIYEDINNNINYLGSYYDDIMTIIESKVYMSPSEYLLARNISKVYYSIYTSKQYIDKWYNIIKDEKKGRVAVLHNNLRLSHFLRNKNSYLINWDKSTIDIPIFDIYKLCLRHSNIIDFEEILKKYESNYPLQESEKYLLYSLLLLPEKIEFNKSEYKQTIDITIMIDRIDKLLNFLSPENFKERT